jgi:glycoside/pentoside/hexuronide:cation symporter, GPH family
MTYRTRWIYGSGGVVYGIAINAQYFALIFYSQVLGLSPQLAALALGIGFFIDAISDPLVGYLSDNTRSRWGRRHPYLYASILPLTLSYFYLWHPPAFVHGDLRLFLYLITCNILMYLSLTMFLVPAFALAAELSSDYEERTQLLTAYWSVLSIFSNGFSVLMYAFWLAPTAEIPDGMLNPAGYQLAGLIAAILIAVAALTFSLGLHEKIPQLRKPATSNALGPAEFYRQVRVMLRNPSLRAMMGSGVLFYAGIGVYMALWVYIYSYFWGFTTVQISMIVIPMALASLTLPPIMERLSRGREKRQVGTIGLVGAMVLNIVPITLRLMGWFPGNGTETLFWTMLVLGFFETIVFLIFTISWVSMTSDITEQEELATGRRNEGVITALTTFAQKCSRSVGTVLTGTMLALIAFPTGTQVDAVPAEAIFKLGVIYGPVIGSIFLLTCYVFNRYGITREQHAETVLQLAVDKQRQLAAIKNP